MGKASSSKKVARAAKSGGRTKVRQQRSLLFPGAVLGVFVLGLALVVYARHDRRTSVDSTPPQSGIDHWHVAYGVYACDKFEPPVTDQNDPLGIHTHGDGVIHIHPTSAKSSGTNARLGRFFDASGIEMSNDKLTLPNNGGSWSNGDKCGDKPGKLKVAVWKTRTTEKPEIITGSFRDIPFTNDMMLMTIGFVPDGVDLPKPESESVLDNLSDVASTTTTVAGTDTSTTVAGTDTSTTVGSSTTASSPSTTAAATSTSAP